MSSCALWFPRASKLTLITHDERALVTELKQWGSVHLWRAKKRLYQEVYEVTTRLHWSRSSIKASLTAVIVHFPDGCSGTAGIISLDARKTQLVESKSWKTSATPWSSDACGIFRVNIDIDFRSSWMYPEDKMDLRNWNDTAGRVWEQSYPVWSNVQILIECQLRAAVMTLYSEKHSGLFFSISSGGCFHCKTYHSSKS